MKMNIDKFEKIHKAFLRSYNLDDGELPWRPDQKKYKKLKKDIEKILGEK